MCSSSKTIMYAEYDQLFRKFILARSLNLLYVRFDDELLHMRDR